MQVYEIAMLSYVSVSSFPSSTPECLDQILLNLVCVS
jgi:hypothetical protein